MQTFVKACVVGSYNGCQDFGQMAVILKSKLMAMIIIRKWCNMQNFELWIVANVEIKYTRI